MGHLSTELEEYGRRQAKLEAAHPGQWAVIHGDVLIGTYADYNEASLAADDRLGGDAACLIQEIGAGVDGGPGIVVNE